MFAMRKMVRVLLLAFAAAPLLAGCIDNTPVQSRPCPVVRTFQDASFLTRFAGESEDLTEASFEARLARSRSVCYYQEDTSTGETVIRTELNVEFTASRGPKNADSAALFNYWIRITGPGGVHLPGDQSLDVQIPFTASAVQGVAQDQVTVYIPLKKGENGDFYRINIGLELTEKELAYNRRNPQY